MKKTDVSAHVLDGLDIETYLICKDEKEGRALAYALMSKLGLKNGDVVMTEPVGGGVRVRMRAMMNSPNEEPGWLSPEKKDADTRKTHTENEEKQ